MSKTAIAVALLSFALPAAAANWTAVPASSKLTFHGVYQGEAFDGSFGSFTAQVAFDAATPDATKITATVDLKTADTQNAERDETLRGNDFFWTEKFPQAKFETGACKALKVAGHYECAATLTIRDKTQPVTFPFELTVAGDTAKLKASVTLDRLKFDVGGGDWTDAETIAHEVQVDVDVTLKPGS